MDMTQTIDQSVAARAEFVAILEELKAVLCEIHEGEIPARFIAFDELAARIQDGAVAAALTDPC